MLTSALVVLMHSFAESAASDLALPEPFDGITQIHRQKGRRRACSALGKCGTPLETFEPSGDQGCQA